jgi:hypothetical protein
MEVMLGSQALSHLSHSVGHFCFTYFSGRVLCFLPELALNCDPPFSVSQVAGIRGMCYTSWPKFFTFLFVTIPSACCCHSFILCLLCSHVEKAWHGIYSSAGLVVAGPPIIRPSFHLSPGIHRTVANLVVVQLWPSRVLTLYSKVPWCVQFWPKAYIGATNVSASLPRHPNFVATWPLLPWVESISCAKGREGWLWCRSLWWLEFWR